MLRNEATASATDALTQAASATHTTAADHDSSADRSPRRDRRKLVAAYMPSGNTMLHSVDVYTIGTCRRPCFQVPSSSRSGIHHVAHAHMASYAVYEWLHGMQERYAAVAGGERCAGIRTDRRRAHHHPQERTHIGWLKIVEKHTLAEQRNIIP